MLIGCSLFERKRRCFWLLDPLREWVFPGYFSSLYILPHSPACLDTWTDPAHRGTALIRDTVSMRKQIVPAPWKSFALAHRQPLTETAQFKKTFTDTLKKGNFAWSVHCIQKRIFSIQSPPQIFSLLGHYLTPPPGRLDTSNDSATFPNRPQQKHWQSISAPWNSNFLSPVHCSQTYGARSSFVSLVTKWGSTFDWKLDQVKSADCSYATLGFTGKAT